MSWQLTTRGTRLTLKRTLSRGIHGADAVHLVRRFEPLRHEPAEAAETLTPAAQQALAILDQLGVPTDWGRDKVRARLTDHDATLKISNDDLGAAIRARKETIRLSASDMTQLALGEPVPDSEDHP